MPSIAYPANTQYRTWICLPLLCAFAWLTPVSAYEVSVEPEVHAAGAAEKLSDVAYSIKDDDCLIRYNAIQLKADNKRVLHVHRRCDRSFEAQAGYHEDILRRINQDIPIASFASLNWGGFSFKDDYSWVIPIALASDSSATYQDYRQNYPFAKVNNINQIFVELANQSRAYQPLADLFADYDIALSLDAVEKVFAAKAGKLPFYDELTDKRRIGKHVNVIYDAGMSYFRLVPLP